MILVKYLGGWWIYIKKYTCNLHLIKIRWIGPNLIKRIRFTQRDIIFLKFGILFWCNHIWGLIPCVDNNIYN